MDESGTSWEDTERQTTINYVLMKHDLLAYAEFVRLLPRELIQAPEAVNQSRVARLTFLPVWPST